MSKLNDLKYLKDTFLEKRGNFQILLIILLGLNSMSVGINHTITSFYTYTPSFYCKDNKNSTCNEIVNGTECPSGYQFKESDDKTVIVEWSLVCSREFIGPLTNTLYFVGVTIGSIVCSTLSDKFGRKKLVLACMYMPVVMAICLYFGNSLALFIIFRLVQGIFVQGLQTCSYTLIMEYCPARHRTAAAIFWELNWTFGLMILGGIAYFIRDWRILTLVMTAPIVLSIIYFWLIPESISWLYVTNRHKECITVIKRIAKRNEDTQTLENCSQLEFDVIRQDADMINKSSEVGENDEANTYGIMDLLRSYVLRKHLIVMISVWFTVTLSYYGILYYLPNLAGQRHVNFLIGAVVENIAYISAYFVLSNFGRRIPIAIYQVLNGILLILISLSYFLEESDGKGWAVLILALAAKGLTVCNFGGMFMYASELFPTICRGSALGLCCFSARCASLLAPQFMFLTAIIPPFIPMIIMGIAIVLTGIATLLLPETLNIQFPNTIEDAHKIWGK